MILVIIGIIGMVHMCTTEALPLQQTLVERHNQSGKGAIRSAAHSYFGASATAAAVEWLIRFAVLLDGEAVDFRAIDRSGERWRFQCAAAEREASNAA
jgi:hypothetical protein